MMVPLRFLAIAAPLAIAGCAPTTPARKPAVAVEAPLPEPEGWRAIASTEDAGRIERLDSAWTAGLSEAQGARYRGAIADEAELLRPDAGLPRAAPPPGSYRCRVLKLGAQGKGPAFRSYQPFFCYVEAEGELLTITKQTGSQRPAGRLYPDSDDRMIFLGTLALGAEEEILPYGEKAERDMAGVVERVGPFRWRLVIPWPRIESKIDVIELVPAIVEPPR